MPITPSLLAQATVEAQTIVTLVLEMDQIDARVKIAVEVLGANPVSFEIASTYDSTKPYITRPNLSNELVDVQSGAHADVDMDLTAGGALRVRATASGGASDVRVTIMRLHDIQRTGRR